MDKRRRGRPAGYVSPDNCRVTDPVAFVALFRMLREHAALKSRGGASALAWVLDVTHVLVVQYCRKAPLAVTPALWAALERAPLLMERYPFPFETYFELFERAIDRTLGERTPAPHTRNYWNDCTPAEPLEKALGPAIHVLRAQKRISPDTVRALPLNVWLSCSAEEGRVIQSVVDSDEMPDRMILRLSDGDNNRLVLQEPL